MVVLHVLVNLSKKQLVAKYNARALVESCAKLARALSEDLPRLSDGVMME